MDHALCHHTVALLIISSTKLIITGKIAYLIEVIDKISNFTYQGTPTFVLQVNMLCCEHNKNEQQTYFKKIIQCTHLHTQVNIKLLYLLLVVLLQ